MKICFLSSMHLANDKRVFDKESISLVNAGFAVWHLCPGAFEKTEILRGVNVVTYTREKGIKNRLRHLLTLYRKALNIDADVYHCNEVDSWSIGVALKVLHGKRCVFDVHEHYPSTFAQSRFPPLLQPIIAACVRLIFCILTPFTDRFVLAKNSVAADFYTVDAKKILVRNFTQLAALKFSDSPAAEVEKHSYTLVHLGLFSKMRGWPQVLDALARMRHTNVNLLVIGEVNDGSLREFEDRVTLLGLKERVKVLEWMPFEQAFSYLLNADIGIIAFQPGITNHVYAMPHKMFDYMAAGLAVALPEFAVEVAPIITDSKCGVLIDPSNPQDMADKLDVLINSPKIMREMGRRGKEAVRDRYNWETEAVRLIAMYRELEREI